MVKKCNLQKWHNFWLRVLQARRKSRRSVSPAFEPNLWAKTFRLYEQALHLARHANDAAILAGTRPPHTHGHGPVRSVFVAHCIHCQLHEYWQGFQRRHYLYFDDGDAALTS